MQCIRGLVYSETRPLDQANARNTANSIHMLSLAKEKGPIQVGHCPLIIKAAIMSDGIARGSEVCRHKGQRPNVSRSIYLHA